VVGVTDDRRSVVLVTMDSLRYDHCSFTGYERETTPTLDAMAAAGFTVANAVSPGPSTPESMPAVLTGSYPADDDEEYASELAARQARIRRHMRTRTTLAERFRERGYATAGFSPNPYTSRYFGFDAGFDHYEDFIGGSRRRLYAGALEGAFAGVDLSALFPARVLLNWVNREEVFKPWEAFYGAVCEWVRSVEEPYFLWVLLMDTHDPYLVPDGYRSQPRWATYHANWRLWRRGHEPPFSDRTRERLVRAYDDAVRYADEFLARLRADLGTGEDGPIVAVHGDHGEAFGEHGTYGHHQRLYEENVHVPLVIEGPGVPERSVERPVSLTAVPALLRAAAGGGLDAETAGDTGATNRPYALSRTLGPGRIALRGRDWKYIAETDPGSVAVEREELYDLASDPGEREDLAATGDHADRRTTCRRVVRRRLAHEREVADIHRTAAELAGSGRVER